MAIYTRQKSTILGCVLLGLITLLAFWHVLQNGFINYDDGDYITKNSHVLGGLNWDNIKWAFTTTRASNWNPLVWLSHMLDVELFGLNPRWHHLVNLLIHTANAVIVFLLLRDMTGALLKSFFVAALFAVHPLHVESVVWASERKDVLSTLFLLLTLWAYARFVRQRAGPARPSKHLGADIQSEQSRKTGFSSKTVPESALENTHHVTPSYMLAVLFFALGLMSKPMLVTLPFLLLLLDHWPFARLKIGKTFSTDFVPLVREKLPFFILAAISGLITFLAQSHSYSMLGGLPFRLRIATALTSYLKYLGKTIWPSGLAVFYPDPNARYFAPNQTPFYPASEQWPAWQVIAAAVFLLAVSILVVIRRDKQPWLFTGWYWYLGALVPVIGLVQAGIQVMADRYTYVPLIGIFILLIWGAVEFVGPARNRLLGLSGLGALILVACCLVTRHQVTYWRDDQTLFHHAMAITSRNPMAEWMVGAGAAQNGQFGLAQTHFRLALAADPYLVEARSALGSLFEAENRSDLAMGEYQMALRMKPQDEFSRLHLAGALRKLGRDKEALAEYKEAIRWNPDSIEANTEAGALLLDAGNLDEAERCLSTALLLNPKQADALLCLSELRSRQGRPAEAAKALQSLVQLYPGVFELRLNLGGTLWKAGQQADALVQYREALRLNPSQPIVHYDLATVCMDQGQFAEACGEYVQALQLKQDYLDAAIGLGCAAVARGDFKQAQSAFEHAVQLAPTNACLLANLGMALSKGGDTNNASEVFARATQLQPDLASACVAQGKTLLERGQITSALVNFNTAVCLDQNSAKCLSALAWLLATHPQPEVRNGPRALALARRAVELAGSDASAWAALDVACAETGSFQAALQAAEKSKALAVAAGDQQAARETDLRIESYRHQERYHLR